MRVRFWILAILMLVSATNALFEHEVGRNDWVLHTLGNEIYNAQTNEQNPNAIFTTSEKILTSVDKNRGSINWRKEIPSTEGYFRMYLFAEYVLVHNSRDVFVFNSKNGELYVSLNSQNTITGAQMVWTDKAPVVVFSDNNGTHMYQNGIKKESNEDKFISLAASDKNTLYGLKEESDSYSVHSIESITLKTKKIKSGIKTDKASFTFIKPNNKFFGILNVKGNQVHSIQELHYDGKVEKKNDFQNLKLDDIAITDNDVQAVISRKNKLGKKDMSFEIQNNGVKVYKADDQIAFIQDINIEDNGKINRVHLLSDGKFLIAMQDLTLHLFDSNFERTWARNEALGSIEKFKFLDITESKEAKSSIIHYMKHLESMDGNIAKIPAKIFTRYAHHLQNLISFLSNLPEYVRNTIDPQQNDTFEKDQFGFKKIIVGITKTHDTLLGLQSNNGVIIWTLHVSKLIADSGLLSGPDDELVFSDFHLIEQEDDDNEAVVVISGKKHSLFIVLDPYNGIIKESKLYKNRTIRNTFKTHVAALVEVVIMVDTQDRVLFYPFDLTDEVTKDHPACVKKLGAENTLCQEKIVQDLTFSYYEFEQNDSGLEIKGSTFENDACRGVHGEKSCMSSSWKVPLKNQKLVGYSAKYIPERSHFHSQRATNLNGAILFKYLEPTLFSIATTSSNEDDNSISVYIIDGATGRIVHQFIERNIMMNKPITVLLDENMLILTFSRMGKLGEGIQQIQTLNLYEQNIKYFARDVIIDYLKGKNTTHLYGEMPITIQQAYVFPITIKSMGITRTQQGITGKELILILENDQVYGLKQALISPRRPIDEVMNENLDMDMSGNLQDITLAPYDAFMPLNPQEILSHRHKLIDMREVETVASRLESTSLSITYGSDIFYTTVAPEKQFDILSEDFNKSYLIITIVILFIPLLRSTKKIDNS